MQVTLGLLEHGPQNPWGDIISFPSQGDGAVEALFQLPSSLEAANSWHSGLTERT